MQRGGGGWSGGPVYPPDIYLDVGFQSENQYRKTSMDAVVGASNHEISYELAPGQPEVSACHCDLTSMLALCWERGRVLKDCSSAMTSVICCNRHDHSYLQVGTIPMNKQMETSGDHIYFLWQIRDVSHDESLSC